MRALDFERERARANACSMELDPDIQALKKANRRPLWIGLGVVGGAVACFGLWVLGGASAVHRALEADGHTEIEVKMRSPFDYGYTSKKGAMICGGSFTRLPFSTSQSGTCMGTAEAKPTPARPQHEVLAESLRAQFPTLPVVDARCATIEPGASKVTCALESDAGAPLEIALEKDGSDWKIKSPESILARAALSDTLAEELGQKAKAEVSVDCGAGLFGYSGGEHLTCTATRKGAKKAGSLEITFAADGSYTWKATGI